MVERAPADVVTSVDLPAQDPKLLLSEPLRGFKRVDGAPKVFPVLDDEGRLTQAGGDR